MKLTVGPLLILLFIAIRSFSQETKKVVEGTNDRVKMIYHVLKENKQVKHGPYEQYYNGVLVISGFYKMDKKDSVWQLYNSKGTVLSRKTYAENKRTGVWNFNKYDGTPEWQYDFSNDTFLIKPKETPGYSYLSSNGEWIKGKADQDVVWLRSKDEWQYYLSRNVRYPADAIDKKIQERVFVEITIDENGNVIDYSFPEKVYPSLGEEALRLVKSFQPEFLPAEKDGKKVKSKVQFSVNFGLRG
jgi:TonB family protein